MDTPRTSQPQFAQTALTTDGGMVTANHHLAAEAGARMLAMGGNVVDAALAAAFAVGVVEPAMSGIGGRGYMVIHFGATGESIVIDGHERAPHAARPDMFAIADHHEALTSGWGPQAQVVDAANANGHRAVAVPGVLAALAVVHRRYATLPLKTLLEPAIGLARDGFAVGVHLATLIGMHRAKLARFPATAAIFLRGGYPPTAGERLVQNDLAHSLSLIADRGCEELYSGALADAIVAEMERGGGILTARDLAAYEPRVWDRPLTGTYRDYQILTVPEATGGITVLQIMNLLEGFDLSSAADPHALHILLEALRIAFRDRLAVIEDPAFAPVPFVGLASKAFAAERRRCIMIDRARDDLSPGDPWPFDNATAPEQPRSETVTWRGTDRDTTHICAVDDRRTAVSLTQSIIDPFGSGVVAPGTGILLNSAMHNFNPLPNQPGSIAPWKRSAHNGAPTIVLRPDGRAFLAIGGAGGTKVITGIVQVLVNLIDRSMNLQDAIAAPRVHNEGWGSEIDGRIPPQIIARLRAMGHETAVVQSRYALPAFSRINGIMVDDAGALASGVDIFTDAGAAAVDMAPHKKQGG